MTEKYSLASASWGKEEYDAIQKVVSSGVFTMGKYVSQFEEDFASYFGAKYAVMSNSGSSANLLMIAALFYTKINPLKAGDEIIVPAVSWSTTYAPLFQYNLKLKFVDIDVDTLNYDLHALKEAVSDKTKVILCVNLLGNSNDFNSIKEITKNKEIIILEDNCESMGAEYNGKKTGSIGKMGSFSTFFSHHISTMEGGMTITNDEELYHIMLSLRSHGWTRHLPKENKITGVKSDNNFEESFKFVIPGYNLRPLEMSGAIGIEQLKKLDFFVNKRIENANFFKKTFENNKCYKIQQEIGKSSWFGFSLVINNDCNIDRNKLVEFLQNKGVDVRPIVAGNFTRNEVVKYFSYEIHGELLNADIIDKYGFFVGNHHFSIKKEILYLEKLLNDFEQ